MNRGYANATGKRIVAVDPRYFRPTEADTLLGNPAKARRQLSWTPKISFSELVSEMAAADLRAAERDISIKTRRIRKYSANMNKHAKIHIAGHDGPVGPALVRCLRRN